MKKILMMVAVVAMTAMTITSCNKGGKGNSLASISNPTEADSLAYDFGVGNSEGIKQMMMQYGIDSTYVDEFLKGIKDGATKEANPKKQAYMQGLQVGKDLKEVTKKISEIYYAGDSTKSINVNLIIAGLKDGMNGKSNITTQEAYMTFNQKMDAIQKKNIAKQFADWKKKNEQYLAANKTKEGVVTLPSGVQYKVLVKGDGAVPSDTATINVNYEGKDIEGKVFDSSYQRNQPMTLNMAQVQQGGLIEGWIEILKMMPAGSKWEVTIPAEKAYGSRNMGSIQPFSTLIFTMEVLK